MTYFPDLSPYSYVARTASEHERNVGWLDAQHPFTTGDVPDIVLSKISALCRIPVNQTRGYHFCELCPQHKEPYTIERDGNKLTLGSAEIRVRGSGGIEYACPNLIYHYIKDHRYAPPQEFLHAVLSLPEP